MSSFPLYPIILIYSVPAHYLKGPTALHLTASVHPSTCSLCLQCAKAFNTACGMKLQFLILTLKTLTPNYFSTFTSYCSPLMQSCQTESNAVAEHSLKYFTCAFVHPSSSTEMIPQFSPKHFSSERPLHFICTIAIAHLNFKLSLRILTFNSYKNCLLHCPAHPFWPLS